jgi:hypothetical protein
MMRRLGLYFGRLPGFDKAGFHRQELIECVRTADACGYDSFWLPEAWERDAFTTLTELAVHTNRIHLGTGIVNVFSPDQMVDAVSVCGSIERCRARLDEMYANGAALPIVSIPGEGTTAEKCRVMSR